MSEHDEPTSASNGSFEEVADRADAVHPNEADKVKLNKGPLAWMTRNRVAADDPKLQTVYDHFAANLEDVCAEARDAGVPIIVSTVLTNLKDCPPLHSLRGIQERPFC